MERICKTCMWWCGTEADTNAFCDEKEVPTSAGTYCPKWLKQSDDDLTDVHRQELTKLLNSSKAITDSDVEDFCFEHNVSRRAVFHQLAEWHAPARCKKCEHMDMYMYPNMPPCASCRKAAREDNHDD